MTEQDQETAAVECCMCGDSGLSHELLLCKICRLRSQHRYCSNMYPNSDSYDICNWCLSQSSDTKQRNRIQTDTASFKGVHVDGELKRPKGVSGAGDAGSPPVAAEEAMNGRRRRIITRGKLEEMIKLGRTKSEESSSKISGKVMLRAKFRNKAKRYKLLDEVSN